MELNISHDFTIDNIHKIREYNYERHKNITFKEYKADVEKGENEAIFCSDKLFIKLI